jgi:hypothetical protein
MTNDRAVQNQILSEWGAAFRSVGDRLVGAARVRGGLAPPDLEAFDAELTGILRRVLEAAPVAFAALESGIREGTP